MKREDFYSINIIIMKHTYLCCCCCIGCGGEDDQGVIVLMILLLLLHLLVVVVAVRRSTHDHVVLFVHFCSYNYNREKNGLIIHDDD
jgi:hypothetical protein